MIAVCIATYNHEVYISQTIESVRAQRCDMPIRIYIGDDGSSDATLDLCTQIAKEDKRIVVVSHPQNIGLVANTISLYHRAIDDGCEFIAMLDGDDYWVDSSKLQIQLDYLRAHPETGFVHTAAYDEIEGHLIDSDFPEKPVGDIALRYNLSGAKHTNCTVFFRTTLLRETDLNDLESQHFPVLDYPLYGIFSQYTSFGYIHSYTAVWRNHSSVSHPADWQHFRRYEAERIRMWKWLNERYKGNFHFKWYKAILWYIQQFFYFLFAYLKKKL